MFFFIYLFIFLLCYRLGLFWKWKIYFILPPTAILHEHRMIYILLVYILPILLYRFFSPLGGQILFHFASLRNFSNFQDDRFLRITISYKCRSHASNYFVLIDKLSFYFRQILVMRSLFAMVSSAEKVCVISWLNVCFLSRANLIPIKKQIKG